MAAIAFLLFWIALALGLFAVAMGGGPRNAREHVLHSQSHGGRRATLIVLGVVMLGMGIAVPTYVIASNKDEDKAGSQGIALTASEKRGRELFGRTCNQCHTLAAANTVGKIGPNLDKLNPPKSLVLDAIALGRARGLGRMPAQLLQGKDARDVAAFVDKVAGRD